MAAGRVTAHITTSLDGFITGPDDRPGQGLGRGGERLHYWVFGGPWTYAAQRDFGTMGADDARFYEELVANVGAGVCGRGMYDAAGAWGGQNPFGGTVLVLTHRTEDAPDPTSGFRFVDDFDAALAQARELAGPEKDVALSGGADLIRQGLAAGVVDQLSLTFAPVILGAGKRLFEGFDRDVELDIASVRTSPWATHVTYTVRR
jgi:dihydrofolate reductase